MQLREKHGDEREIVRAGRVFRRLCDAYDALFIVNDRPELAIACAADGVHVGQDDADAAEVRRLVGAGRADRALDPFAGSRSTRRRGVDYIARRPGARDADEAGLRAGRHSSSCATRPSTRDACRSSRSAASTPATSARSSRAGAERVAVVRAIRDADDPGAAARALRDAIEAALHAGARG